MEEEKNNKIERVLSIYTQLMNGQILQKSDLALRYGVNERSIQRDIDDIRNFLELDMEDSGILNSVIYDRSKKGYRLEQIYRMKFTNSEILAICKILLDSRAFTKTEMVTMLNKLIECCVPRTNQKIVEELIRNEEFHYVELQHKTVFIDMMWEIGQAIQTCRYIEIEYQRMDKKIVSRKLKPVAIMFSEYYFYVTAFIDDEVVKAHFQVINDSFPTIYRIDRIKKLNILEEHFHIPYSSRFEEGEFRKRIAFMYGGKLRKVKFKYSGNSIEAVLDKLPTAKIIAEEEGVYTVTAEVFGNGIDMWLRGQGKNVEILEA
ncbi:MAG: helix-turn-helix transcriptional regulator [Lachnospiraceae bacterium]